MEKTLAVGVCCCLQTCNSGLNMLIMGLLFRKSLMIISIDISPFSCITRVPLLLFTCKLHCLQIFEHTNAYCTSLGFSDSYLLGCWMLLISCRCVLLFTNMYFSCKHCGDGVSTWAKFDGYI